MVSRDSRPLWTWSADSFLIEQNRTLGEQMRCVIPRVLLAKNAQLSASLKQYHPLSKSGSYLADSEQGMGYMIVDSLDSLLVMGFEDEYVRAREWVRNELSFDIEGKVNAFEVSSERSFLSATSCLKGVLTSYCR